jgi:hypothetical protein
MYTLLSDVRSINDAIWKNVNSQNNGVYCVDQTGTVARITRARSRQGVLSVRLLSSGTWIVPVLVYAL